MAHGELVPNLADLQCGVTGTGELAPFLDMIEARNAAKNPATNIVEVCIYILTDDHDKLALAAARRRVDKMKEEKGWNIWLLWIPGQLLTSSDLESDEWTTESE